MNLYAKKPDVIKLPPYCAEFTEILEEDQKYHIQGNREKPYGQCHGRTFVEIEPEELAQNVDNILEKIDKKNKGKIFFGKEKKFEREGELFRKKLLVAAIKNLNQEKRKFLGIYPNINAHRPIERKNRNTCKALARKNQDLALEIKQDKDLSNQENQKAKKTKDFTSEQKNYLKFHLEKSLISQALHLSTENYKKERKAQNKRVVKEELKKYLDSSKYKDCVREQASFSIDAQPSPPTTVCKYQFLAKIRREKNAELAEELLPERANFVEGFKSAPLLYDDSNDFSPLDWVNLKIKPSKLSSELTKDLDKQKLRALGDILNRSKNPDQEFANFVNNNPIFFDFEKKLQDKKLHKKLKKATQKRVSELSNSAEVLCKEKGESLHQHPNFVNEVFASNENKDSTLDDITGQCYLLQKFPKQETDPTKLTYIGVVAIIGGIGLQSIPGAGNAAGAGLIATGAGGALITADAAINARLAKKYDNIAAALKDTDHIDYDDYLKIYKEDRIDTSNALKTEIATSLALNVGSVIKLRHVIKTRLLNPKAIATFEENVTKGLHETWRKGFIAEKGEDAFRLKAVPESISKPGETPAQTLNRLKNEGVKGLSIPRRVEDLDKPTDTHLIGKVVQNINQSADDIIPALNKKLNGNPSPDYVEVIRKNINITSKRDINKISSEIHEVWMRHNEWAANRYPELFVPFNQLSVAEKLKDLDVAVIALQRNPAGISRKTQRLLDEYREELIQSQVSP